MSNLGAYQVMTTLAKRVGGPKFLLGYTMVGGYFVLRISEAGVKKVVTTIKSLYADLSDNAQDCNEYTVTTSATGNDGVHYHAGDKIRILDQLEGNAALIEKVGDENSPYLETVSFLKSISSYS